MWHTHKLPWIRVMMILITNPRVRREIVEFLLHLKRLIPGANSGPKWLLLCPVGPSCETRHKPQKWSAFLWTLLEEIFFIVCWYLKGITYASNTPTFAREPAFAALIHEVFKTLRLNYGVRYKVLCLDCGLHKMHLFLYCMSENLSFDFIRVHPGSLKRNKR